MLRILTIAAAMMAAAPALAQQAPPPEQPAPQPGQPTQPPSSADLNAAIAAEWPKYDHGGKGHLTPEEFTTWLSTLRAQSGGANEDPAKVKAWADGSFVKADADSNKQVTPEEFTAFLQAKMKK